jgi:Ca2+-binding EF-hand superfamily protein
MVAVLTKMVGTNYSAEKLASMVDRIFHENDYDNDDTITFEEFAKVLESMDMEKMSLRFPSK